MSAGVLPSRVEISDTSDRPRAEPMLTSPQLDTDELLLEWEYGHPVEVPMSILSGVISNELNHHLTLHVRAHRLGWVTHEALIVLDRERRLARRPDVAFVSHQRWPLDRPLPAVDDWAVVPDLVVEVLSPTEPMEKVLEKVKEYFHYGVRLVWVIAPRLRLAYVYSSPLSVLVRTEADALEGGEVLPDFRLPLREIFAAVPTETATAR
ncbi:MAG: Uma2 family endonuclease [Gemmatales bacterium]|nr:Uma2 family endonuclease [Gemmatales bacterium]MDW7994574.1 Uma2 family endonuclease [Gemmatales bacterium]